METKGIIISKEDYERLIDLEKNFNDKVKENKESFKKGLEDAIKGNLIKILWINDKYCADLMGCDLSEEGVCKFISKEDADMLASVNSKVSYDRNDVLNDNAKKENAKRIKDHKAAFGLYQEVIADQKKSIRKLRWAFVIMFVAWLIQLIAYIMK
jgi:hemerythrin-like domain-containing protein